MTFDIIVLPGDGIGPEVTAEAVKVLRAVGERYRAPASRWRSTSPAAPRSTRRASPISEETMARCADGRRGAARRGRRAEVGRSQRRRCGPEQALFRLRKELGLFTNLRPVRLYPALLDASPLRPERLQGVDLLIVRELTGGLYFGRPQGIYDEPDGRRAVDTMAYTRRGDRARAARRLYDGAGGGASA